jgi:hypothetical protein
MIHRIAIHQDLFAASSHLQSTWGGSIDTGPRIPRNLHVPSALLIEMVGADIVAKLLQEGKIERGVKDYHRKGRNQLPASEADVADARYELKCQLDHLEQEIRKAVVT